METVRTSSGVRFGYKEVSEDKSKTKKPEKPKKPKEEKKA